MQFVVTVLQIMHRHALLIQQFHLQVGDSYERVCMTRSNRIIQELCPLLPIDHTSRESENPQIKRHVKSHHGRIYGLFPETCIASVANTNIYADEDPGRAHRGEPIRV